MTSEIARKLSKHRYLLIPRVVTWAAGFVRLHLSKVPLVLLRRLPQPLSDHIHQTHGGHPGTSLNQRPDWKLTSRIGSGHWLRCPWQLQVSPPSSRLSAADDSPPMHHLSCRSCPWAKDLLFFLYSCQGCWQQHRPTKQTDFRTSQEDL